MIIVLKYYQFVIMLILSITINNYYAIIAFLCPLYTIRAILEAIEVSSIALWFDSIALWFDSIDLWLHSIDLWLGSIALWLSSIALWLHSIALWLGSIALWLGSIDLWLHSIDLWLGSIALWLGLIDLWLYSIAMWVRLGTIIRYQLRSFNKQLIKLYTKLWNHLLTNFQFPIIQSNYVLL